MSRRLIVPSAAGLLLLAASSTAFAWGAVHAGFNHYGPVTGFDHVGYTAYRGPAGAGGYHYSGYHYGGYGGYGATTGGGYRYGGYGAGAGYHYGATPYGGYNYGAYGYRRAW